jgi:hypothetical protein
MNQTQTPTHVFHAEHPHWRGHIHLYPNGRMERPGIDEGRFEFIKDKSITLQWDRWPAEQLRWDTEKNCYSSTEGNFTLNEIPQESYDRMTSPATGGIIVGALSTAHPDYQGRREKCQRTWLPILEKAGVEVLFLVGTGQTSGEPRIVYESEHGRIGTELQIPCPDDYDSLPQKTAAWCKWSLANRKFSHLFKCDDDTYIVPKRLLGIDLKETVYTGYEWKAGLGKGKGYASGGAGYLLNRDATQIIVECMTERIGVEDMLVGYHLLHGGIELKGDPRFAPYSSDTLYPSPDNNLISGHAHEYQWTHHEKIWKDRWDDYCL